MKKIEVNNIEQFVLKILIIISFPALTLLLSNRFLGSHTLIGVVLSFLIALCVGIKNVSIKKIDIITVLISTYISLYMIKEFISYSINNVNLIQKFIDKYFDLNISFDIIVRLLGIFSIPALAYIVYKFIKLVIPKIKKELKKITKTEMRYLIIMFIVAIITSIGITITTTAFSKPLYNNNVVFYDVIYTSDNGAISYKNTYFNVSYDENDIRQPLFGIMSLPFSVPAKFFSEICFFFPQNYAYEIIFTIMQFLLTTITTILIGRLLKLDEKDKKYLYLLFSLSFPYIIFNLVLEQYVIGLFYLILAIYLYNQNQDKINYMYIGAVGTMLTSGIIFPLITKFKSKKQWFFDVFKCFLGFMSVLIIGGQFPQILTAKEKLLVLNNNFSGKLSFYDKMCQFLNFVKGIFFSPNGNTNLLGKYPSYQLEEVSIFSIIGIIIIGLIIISFILNRKNKFATISFCWVLFSFILLCIIGWGTAENGLILYSLYFSWAYLVLIFLLLKRCINNRKLFVVIFCILIVIMSICNINEFINIMKFAIKYY